MCWMMLAIAKHDAATWDHGRVEVEHDLLYPAAARFGNSAARESKCAITLPSISVLVPLCLWVLRIVCHSSRRCRAHGQNLGLLEIGGGSSIVL